ncbi:MAG: flagellar hook-basal body protein [Candidatus Gastranaerophilales bacterium]|nr:flagellar hook-basal body protein [Candidatus Gastranaerophilales bacterium]
MITRGITTLSKGMQAMIDFQDVTAHNLANVTTDGFKKTKVTFQDILQSGVNTKNAENKTKEVGSLSIGSRIDRTYIDFSQGALVPSDRNMDVAFQGDGFFKVRYNDIPDNAPYNEKNYYYERTGHFKLDDQNYLINREGDYIMDTQNRRIRITRDPDAKELDEINRFDLTKDMLIGENGQIELNAADYRVTLQKIQVCDFEDKTKISGIGQGKYLPIYGQDAGLYVKKDGTFNIQQGFNEASNANTINEMLNTINVSRGYEAMSNMLRTQSESLQGVISLGNLSA